MSTLAVLCVDDNQWIGDSVARLVRTRSDWRWVGWLPNTQGVIEALAGIDAAVVLLDIDLPGENPFALIEELATKCPGARVLMLSGHLSASLVDRALAAGAWGYLCKNDDAQRLVDAIQDVADGRVVLSSGLNQIVGEPVVGAGKTASDHHQ